MDYEFTINSLVRSVLKGWPNCLCQRALKVSAVWTKEIIERLPAIASGVEVEHLAMKCDGASSHCNVRLTVPLLSLTTDERELLYTTRFPGEA